MPNNSIPQIQLPLENPTIPPPGLVNLKSAELLHPGINAILKEVEFYNTNSIQYYPFLPDKKDRIAQLLKTFTTKMTLSAGSDLMIMIIIEALATIKKKIILQSPSYASWQNFAALRNIEITLLPLGQTEPYTFCLTDFIETLVASSPSLVVIVNPHSPTGFLFSYDDILILASCCETNGHILIVDECFCGFSMPSHIEKFQSMDHVILIRSFSKSFGIAGARIAVTIASSKITQYLSHWRSEFTVTGPSILILEHMLQNQKRIENIYQEINLAKKRFILELSLIKPTWRVLPSSANFVVIVLEKDCPKRFSTYMITKGYCIGNLSGFKELEHCIRITIADWSIMQKVLNVIKKYPLS